MLGPAWVRTRGDLMARLDGLPSDEPFAIPATRMVPVFASELDWLPRKKVSAMQAGSNHESNVPPEQGCGIPPRRTR